MSMLIPAPSLALQRLRRYRVMMDSTVTTAMISVKRMTAREIAVVGHQGIIDEPLLEHRACLTYQRRKEHHQRHHHELLFIIRA